MLSTEEKIKFADSIIEEINQSHKRIYLKDILEHYLTDGEKKEGVQLDFIGYTRGL